MGRVKPRITMQLVLMSFIILPIGLGAEESAFSRPLLEIGKSASPGKSIKNLKKSQIFQHPSPSPECLTSKACKKEALIRCLSKKALIDSCSEIYSGSWITTCVCE